LHGQKDTAKIVLARKSRRQLTNIDSTQVLTSNLILLTFTNDLLLFPQANTFVCKRSLFLFLCTWNYGQGQL